MIDRTQAMDRLIAQDADLIDLPTQSDALFNAIKHGDAEHQAWLKQALENHFKGLPMPPVQGGKSSQPTQSDALREALEGVLPYVLTNYFRCNGDKCRHPTCESCCGEDFAESQSDKANLALSKAKAALAALQEQSK
jgi:hypothetical protein